jgi:hypothetical protein
MQTVRRAAVTAATLVAGVVAALALAGCAAADHDSAIADRAESDGAQGAPGGQGAGPPAFGDADGATGPGAADGGEAGGTLTDSRSIIFTGEITLLVEEVSRGARDAVALAQRHGGFVGGDERLSGDHGDHARLVLRIPSESFTVAVDDLAGLGEEQSRRIDTEDVTEAVVDIATRIATAQASVDRTRELMERAETIADIVSVERELTDREARLASLQARQRELADLTALSTITVTLIGPEESGTLTAEETTLGFLAGLSAGWHAFTRSMTVLVTVFGALLPWLIAAGVPTAALLWWRRHRGRGVTTAAPLGTPPAGP